MVVQGIQSTSWSLGWCYAEANVNAVAFLYMRRILSLGKLLECTMT